MEELIFLSTIAPANQTKKKMIYLVRHAEAIHNIKEREAVQEEIAKGELCTHRHEKARKKVLECPSLRDAPLSYQGTLEARRSSSQLSSLIKSGDSRYKPPQIVFVSPLRRALMTATELFLSDENLTGAHPTPRFLAIEALREKRTGLPCDERCDVETLKAEFPHVDFSDVERGLPAVPIGEDNVAVRERARAFLEDILPLVQADFVALISHKGWLRELRQALKGWVDEGRLKVDFDVHDWHQTLYHNAEIRVADFEWEQNVLTSIVSRSVDNAISSIVACTAGEETGDWVSHYPVTP